MEAAVGDETLQGVQAVVFYTHALAMNHKRASVLGPLLRSLGHWHTEP